MVDGFAEVAQSCFEKMWTHWTECQLTEQPHVYNFVPMVAKWLASGTDNYDDDDDDDDDDDGGGGGGGGDDDDDDDDYDDDTHYVDC